VNRTAPRATRGFDRVVLLNSFTGSQFGSAFAWFEVTAEPSNPEREPRTLNRTQKVNTNRED
jgi:hypothetical protein